MWKRRRADEDFSSEIQAHIALETDRLIGEGVPPEEARLAARKAFGNVAVAEERFYDARRIMWLDHLRQDVRGALRAVARYPVAALVAVVSLAFGIGAMTTTLMVRDVVFRKPPALYARPADLSLVLVSRPDRPAMYPYDTTCPGTLYNAWRDAALPGLEIAAAAPARAREVRLADRTESVAVRAVTPNLFDLLGVGAVAGRTFTDATWRSAGATPAVLSARLWETLFDSRPDAIGRSLWIDGEAFVVAGVVPRGFWFADMNAPIWIPIDRGRLTADDQLLVLARRPADLTPNALAGALTPALEAQASALPAAQRQRRVVTHGVEGTPMGSQMAILLPYVLGASVVLTLFIACANVAILMIAQWTAREHEIAIRASLGASRGRIVRALLTESVLLASTGGALGVAVTFALRGIMVHGTRGDGSYFNLAVDPGIFIQSAAIAFLSGLVAGIVPALYETRRMQANPLNTLASSDRTRQRWRHALVVVEISVTIALLVETGAMIGGYQRALAAEMGFDRRPLLDAQVENRAGVPVAQLLESVARIPGVAAAAASTAVPFMGSNARQRVSPDGGASIEATADRIATSPGLFAALGVALVEGRDFSAADAGARVAIVNEALAHQLFPGRPVLGARVAAGGSVLDIVGVAADYAHHQFQQRHLAAKLFVPLPLDAAGAPKQVRIVVRAAGDPAPLIRTLRRELPASVAGLTVGNAFTYEEITQVSAQEVLVGTAPLVPLIVIGMLLTTAGIYGVLAFAIARRSRELAVRVAIGATGRDLVRLVTAHSARLVLIGTACGIGLTFALSRIVRASGGAGSIYDPAWPAFVVPVLIVAVIGALATLIPSRRALKINPAVVLRNS